MLAFSRGKSRTALGRHLLHSAATVHSSCAAMALAWSTRKKLMAFLLLLFAKAGCCFAEESPQAMAHHVVRELKGSGAHRQLHTILDVGVRNWSSNTTQECDVVLVEILPNTLFADAYELQRLEQTRARAMVTAVKRARVSGDTNLEQPACRSEACVVEVQTAATKSGQSSKDEVPLHAKITLPLHARYPAVSTESHFSVHIHLPHEVSLLCNRPRSEGWRLGLHIPVSWGKNLPEPVLWQIPAGNPSHASIVRGATAFSALAGVLAIVVACLIAYSQRHPIPLKTVARKLNLR